MSNRQLDRKPSRREVLKTTAAAAGAGVLGFPYIVPASALGRGGAVAPSERVVMGAIGNGGQGTYDLSNFLNDKRVQVVAVCDVNRESAGYGKDPNDIRGREPARRMVEKHYADQKEAGAYKGCDAYNDFRELLAREDIEAVSVSTPDHWHALISIAACKAGKDVYCQKPLSLTIAEGRAMSDAVKKYNRVFQTGSQQRSDARFRFACELVRNGRIGKLQKAICGLPGGGCRWEVTNVANRKKPEPVPEGFDYDLWLGQAPKAPYCPARCLVTWRWIFDYAGGMITDWGGHHPDIAQWGMNTEHTGPIEIRNAHGEFPPDELWNTAASFYIEAVYKNGVVIVVADEDNKIQKVKGGVTFEGTEGKVWVTRGAIDAEPKSLLNSEIGPSEIHLYRSNNHYRNFIECVRSREEPIAPAEVAHRSITICHLGNIAMRLGVSNLKWDPDKERIIGNDEAARMLSRAPRAPWKLEV
jgi:predicted dehydrogenase